MDETEARPEDIPPVSAETESDNGPAWEMIDTGRYRPRRIRGSYRGRELG